MYYSFGFIETLDWGLNATESIAEQWDAVWQQVFGLADEAVTGQLLYNVLAQIGHLFAVGCLVVLAVQFFNQLNEGRWDILSHFLWALVVAALLANNGRLLVEFSTQLRDYIFLVNQQVLEYTLAGSSLQENFQQLQQAVGNSVIAANYFQHCEFLVGEAQKQCLEEVAAQLEVALQQQQAAGNNSLPLDWLLGVVQDLLAAANQGPNQLGRELGNLFLPVWESAVFSVLNGFMVAYQHILELSLLLTALMGPLAVGGSLLPGGPKALSAWLTGFFAVGFAKLAFNITAGLAATAASANTMPDQLPLYAIFGLLAPLISSGLALGGGLAVWNSLSGGLEAGIGLIGKSLDLFL